MLIVPRSSIVVRDRQRKKINPTKVNEIKESISGKNLLNPPTCYDLGEGGYLLIAGETRLKAMDALAEEKRPFFCNLQEVQPGQVPILLCNADNLLQQKEIELDENLLREELSWQDRTEALAEIHKLRQEANPKQTLQQTAEELSAKGSVGTLKTIGTLKENIRRSVIIAPHLSNPVIASARNESEAMSLILKQEEERANAVLAKRSLSRAKVEPDIKLRQGDLLDILPTLDEQQFDLILADPPYGINASGGGFRSRTIHHHNYDDTPEYARKLLECILIEGFRLAKQRANLFLFTDISHWDWLQNNAARIGWTPFRRPLIWGKSDSEGLAPWGANGPRITTDFIFYATKGQKGLLASPIDYIRVNRVPRNERIHAAEKPVELVRRLLECSTLEGDLVLDCCCGSGSTLVACKELKRRGLGIEKDTDYFNTAMSNVYMGKGNSNAQERAV